MWNNNTSYGYYGNQTSSCGCNNKCNNSCGSCNNSCNNNTKIVCKCMEVSNNNCGCNKCC